jgi:hypothetical protein
MGLTNIVLWDKLSNFSLDNPEASFSFSDRLARENGWSLDFSKRVIDEYKKFIYMSVISGKSLTPSDEVDQAWHLHLVYSYSYWVEMCENTLGGFRLHHGPTKGGFTEKKRYDNQYSETIEFYKNEFGYEPPKDIWPNHKIRFGKVNFRRVSMHDNYVLNKENVKTYMLSLLTIFLALFGGALFLSATPPESYSEADILICVILGVFIFFFLFRGFYRYLTRKNRTNKNSSSSSSDGGCTIFASFLGCGGDSSSGCGSSGCGSSGCGSSGCGSSGCGGCGG